MGTFDSLDLAPSDMLAGSETQAVPHHRNPLGSPTILAEKSLSLRPQSWSSYTTSGSRPPRDQPDGLEFSVGSLSKFQKAGALAAILASTDKSDRIRQINIVRLPSLQKSWSHAICRPLSCIGGFFLLERYEEMARGLRLSRTGLWEEDVKRHQGI